MYAFKQNFSLPGNRLQLSVYVSDRIKSLVIVKYGVVSSGRYKAFNRGAISVSELPRHLIHLQCIFRPMFCLPASP